MIKLDQEIGKRYGRLVVIEKTDKRYHSTTIYKCRCDCGNIVELTINKLHSGHTKSCGCLKRRTVDLRFAYTKNKKNYWECKCDCGNTCFVPTTYLTTGVTISCGCKNEQNRAALSNLDRGLVDGTMLCGIKKDRKLNKNNTSGVRGVHFDKDRGLWVAQIMFQRKAHILGRFKTKAHILGRFKTKREAISARLAGEEEYYGKYR